MRKGRCLVLELTVMARGFSRSIEQQVITMKEPELPNNESERMAALMATGLLDSPAEERFDRITRLAAQFFDVGICLVSLVDGERQWFKSRYGLDEAQPPRGLSFCAHAILGADILEVPDTWLDPRFADSPVVTGAPFVRFYAGAPVKSRSGHALGTLCLVDSKPRQLSEAQRRALRDFADCVEQEINLLGDNALQQQLAVSRERSAAVLQALPDIVLRVNRDNRLIECMEHPDLPAAPEQLIGRTLAEVLPAAGAQVFSSKLDEAFATGRLVCFDYELEVSGQRASFEARITRIDPVEAMVIVRNTSHITRTQAELGRLSEVARQTTNGVVICAADGRVVWINEAFAQLTGFTLEEMLGRRPGDLLQGPDTDPEAVVHMRQALLARRSFKLDVLNYHKNGEAYWVRIACNPLLDRHGNFDGFIAIESDVTQEKRDAERIANSERLLGAVVDANSIGTWKVNLKTGELTVNSIWAGLLGYTLEQLQPISMDTWERLTHPEDVVQCKALLQGFGRASEDYFQANVRMRHADGHWVWINMRGRVVARTAAGKIEVMLGTHFDISNQVHAEQSLREQSERMRVIVDNMLDGVISIDAKGTIKSFNAAAQGIFGYSSAKVVGENISMLMPEHHHPRQDFYVKNYLADYMRGIAGTQLQLEGVRANGQRFPAEIGVSQVQQDSALLFIVIVRDITQRKQDEHEIRQLAFYDALTLLPNRRLLLDRLEQALAASKRHRHYGALLFLDLDNFKKLNDTAGHAQGDLLLQQVAGRLRSAVREGDTVSRLGGDEFVVMLEELGADVDETVNRAEHVAQKILAELSRSFDLAGNEYRSTPSIGVTLFQGSSSSEDVLKQADMAMYQAKASGRNSVRFFDPLMQIAAMTRIGLERDLHDALQQRQFELFYQRQVDQSGATVGAEVLLRWRHPQQGFVSPANFIPVAEETGLIVPIGRWALEEACRCLARWAADAEKSALTIAVNISVAQFLREDLEQTVVAVLQETGANPARLKLEITESLLASDIHRITAQMAAIRRHGVIFSLDDFGTGYSSLTYLKRLPLNQLKIDQSFVRDILSDSNDLAIAQTIVALAETMGLDVIAEGVETQAQRALLHEIGCNHYQGYLYGRPQCLEEFEQSFSAVSLAD
jgi:diguanylate cyclase (GGDEF)-like protein/PAS domain S-box-containing protein